MLLFVDSNLTTYLRMGWTLHNAYTGTK